MLIFGEGSMYFPAYSKYDYQNKETDNGRNAYSGKRLKTSFGEVDAAVPRNRK